ncbi:MAG: recombinase family protein [Blautia sp.]|nr:recombinase family protein [Blautia sp.]
MLAEAEAEKIGTIIVKDMNRFCRNYLEVGFYTEILFPKKQIRFIAINNSVDNDKPQDNDFTPFLNIMNEWYAKDTSNKISRARSGGKSRHRNGEAERRFQISTDRRFQQFCFVACLAVCLRRCSHWHNDCQQKEKVQQIIE